MNLNFIEEFKNYSNLELLKIIKNPSDYQQAAVDAAQAILSTRSISNEEVQKADDHLTNFEERVYHEKGISKSIFHPSSDHATSRWLKFLWLVLAVQYVKTLFDIIPSIYLFFHCTYCHLNLYWLTSFVNLLYIPVIYILLLSKSKWGWVILLGETVFTGALVQLVFLRSLLNTLKSFYYLDLHTFHPLNYMWFVFIRTFLLMFLLKEGVVRHFKVSDQLKEKAIILAFAADLIYLGVVYYLLYTSAPF